MAGKFNPYISGYGLDPPRRKQNENRMKTVYVGNVPTSVSDRELMTIFQKFGNIITIFIGDPKPLQKFTYALVEYSSVREANIAVDKLDCCPPYNFVVSLSWTEEETKRRNLAKQHVYEDSGYNHTMLQPRRHVFSRPTAYIDEDKVEDEDLYSDEDLEYDVTPISRYKDNISDAKPNMSTFRMVLNKDGGRQVHIGLHPAGSSILGPVYPIEIVSKEVRKTIDDALTNLMFKLQKENETEDDDDDKTSYGACKVCGIITGNACNRCLVWYCTSKCQIKDWPLHKQNCIPLPELQCMKKVKQPKTMVAGNDDSKFKQPSNFVQHNHGRGDVDRNNEVRFGNKNRNENKSNFDGSKKYGDKNSDFEDKNISFRNNKFGEANKGQGDDGNRGFRGSNDKFGETNISLGDRGNRYFGDRNNKFGGVSNGLGEDQSKSYENRNRNFDDKNKGFGDRNINFKDRNKGLRDDRNKNVGNKIFVDNNRTNGHFVNDRIDGKIFGRTDRQENNHHSEDKIHDAEDTQLWDDNVKTTSTPVKEDNPKTDLATVLQKPVKMEVLKPVESRVEVPKSITPQLLPFGVFKEVTIVVVVGEGHFCVQLNEMIPSYKEMLIKLNKMANRAETFTPVEKAKCIVQSDGMWFRGLIKSVTPLTVAYVDYGNTERCRTDQIKTIPEEFTKFQRMAVRVKLAPGTREECYHYQIDHTFFVKATTKDAEGALIIEVRDTGNKLSPAARPVFKSLSAAASVSKVDVKSAAEKKEELPSNYLLPSNVFTEVTVTAVENKTDFWVQSNARIEDLVEIMQNVKEEAPTAGAFTPVLDAKCLGLYLEEWYRGQVTSLSPLKVFFIDYGNEETCTVDQLRVMSSELSLLPPQAIKIRLAEGTPEEFSKKVDDGIKVKPVAEANGIIIVHVEGHDYVVKSEPEPKPFGSRPKPDGAKCGQLKNITELLKNNYSGIVGVQQCTSNHQVLVTIYCSELMELNSLLKELTDVLEEQPYDEFFKPKIGEVVGIKLDEKDDEWIRGIYYKQDKCISCDNGNEIIPVQLKKIPSKYHDLPVFAAICEIKTPKISEDIIKNTYFKEDGSDMYYEVTKVNDDGSVEACLKSEEKDVEIGQAIFKTWQPSSIEPRILLKSGTDVSLICCHSYDSVYVISLEPQAFEFSTKITEFGKHCQKEGKLNTNPEVGDLVACKFSKDKEWYRAEILEKDRDNYKVLFVDYGNSEVTTISSMKSYPELFKHIPYCAIEVGLANKLDKPFTQDVLDWLKNLESESFKIEIKNDDLSSVVLLKKDGSSLNDLINTAIDPNWKLQQQKSQEVVSIVSDIITLQDLPETKLNVGAELELLVLLITDHPRVLIACDVKSETFKVVNHDLHLSLQNYCSSLPNNFYKPTEGEICAAYFEDEKSWYRAMCMNTYEDESKVMLIDYGNEYSVKHSGIRKLTADFTKVGAMGIVCTYDAIPEKNCSETLVRRFKELVKLNELSMFMVKSYDEGSYTIDMPSVTLSLQKEGLL